VARARLSDAPQRVGVDGLLEPVEVPHWLDRLNDWLARQLAKPTPRGLRWLDRLEDRVPVWTLPWLVCGLMGGLAALIYAVPRLIEWLR
jgi:hypothetical protein